MGPTAILLLASACAPPPAEPDPALLEAVDWYTGVAGTVDNARSRALLEEAVSRETPLAVMWQARVHSTGRMGYPRDVPADLGRALAPPGHRRRLSAHNLGNAYAAGHGVTEDHALAVEWWTRAAEQGDAITQLRLGEAYEAGRGVPADLGRALDWYRRAAAAGNAQAREALERLAGRDGASRCSSQEE